jgi:hypothetical protein
VWQGKDFKSFVLEVWQRKDLQANFADVWQGKELRDLLLQNGAKMKKGTDAGERSSSIH